MERGQALHSGQEGPAARKIKHERYALLVSCLEDPRRIGEFIPSSPHRKALEEWFSRPRAGTAVEQALELWVLLFNHGLFFDAHEHLEAFWRKAQGEPKIFLQGLIQIAAAFHKLELDPEALAGARELLEEGLAKLERTGRAPEARAALRPALERLRAGRSPSDVPRLEVIHKNFPGSFCE